MPPTRPLLAVLALILLPWIYFWPGAVMEVMLGDGDAFVQFMPTWTWAASQWKALSVPTWNPYIFSGFPLFADPTAAVFHPLQILFMLVPPVVAMNITVLLYYGMASVFTYVLARQEGLSISAAMLAGIVFGFCGFLVSHQGITPLLMTAAALPTIFCAIGFAQRRPGWLATFLMSIAVLHLVLAGHPQFTFYAFVAGAAYWAYKMWQVTRSERLAVTSCVGIGGILGLGLAAVQLLPTLELTGHSIRDHMDYAAFAEGSYPPWILVASLLSTRLLSLLPANGTEAALDVGAFALVLVVLGAVLRLRRSRFWLGLLFVSTLLWLGRYTPLYELTYHVPGFNMFRIASRYGLLIDFSAAMLAAHGVDAVRQRRSSLPVVQRRALIVLLPVAFIVGWQWMGGRVFAALWRAKAAGAAALDRAVVEQHLVPLAPELLIILLAGFAILAALLWSGGGRVIAWLCVLLVFVHHWGHRSWIFTAPAHEVRASLRATALVPEIKEARTAGTGEYRIALGAPANWILFLQRDRQTWRQDYVEAGGVDLNMLHGVASIGGYSPLMRRDYAGFAGDMEMWGSPTNSRLFHSAKLDLLNVRYVVVPPPPLGFTPDAFAGLDLVAEREGLRVYRNPQARGLVWAVNEVAVASPIHRDALLGVRSFDTGRVALMTAEQAAALPARRFARPRRLVARQVLPDRVAIESASTGTTLLASSLTAYPGWEATLDGEPLPLLRLNGLFWGMVLPPGEHQVELRYRPASLVIGAGLSALSAAMLLVGGVVTVVRRRRAWRGSRV